jgi:hypothetical protein
MIKYALHSEIEIFRMLQLQIDINKTLERSLELDFGFKIVLIGESATAGCKSSIVRI